MGAVRSWLTGVILTALLSSLIRSLLPEGAVRRIGAFTGGLVLMSAMLLPFLQGRLDLPDLRWETYEEAVAQRKAELDGEAARELETQVARRTEALIKVRGAELGLSLDCAVTVRGDPPLPWSAALSAERDPDLERWIEAELGIPALRIAWGEE